MIRRDASAHDAMKIRPATMWNSRIGPFILLLVAGYILTALAIFRSGQDLQRRLARVAEQYLPAEQQSTEAKLAFASLLKSYETAILTGETYLLDVAGYEYDELRGLLAGLESLDRLDTERRNQARDIRGQLEAFIAEAHPQYARLTADDADEETAHAIVQLAAVKETLQNRFADLSSSLAQDLRREFQATITAADRERNIGMLLFFGAVLTLAVISITHDYRVAQREIVERKNAERSLQASEQQLRTLFEESPDAIFVESASGSVLAVNQAACDLHGMPRDKLIGRQVLDLIPQEDREIVQREFPKWFTGELTFYEGHSRRANGISIPVEIRSNAIRYQGQDAVLMHVRDITERIRAEEALRQSEARNRAIVGALPDLMFRMDRDGRYLDYHAANPDLLLVPPDAFMGQTASNVLPPDIAEKVMIHIRRALEENRIQVFEYDLTVSSGPRHFESRMVTNSENEVITIIRDLTERKRLEEEQLKSQKLESLGVLAGGIAHDFNNLLTAILGNISMARMAQSLPKSETGELLEEAERASLRARHLTQQLLTFAKGGEPIKRLTDIGAIIREYAGFVLRGSSSTFEAEIPDDLWFVYVDPGQIGQVIHNVVMNADQSMPHGGIIRIRVENVIIAERDEDARDAGRYVRITVSDAGHGIPPDHIDKIFDPYFTTKQKGSGLGLATSLSIVRKHGGTIEVMSEGGKGTTLCIDLPATEVRPGRSTPSAPTAAPARTGHILVMDDEVAIRKLARRILEKGGFTAETAAHGQEAIDLYKAARTSGRPFDAVILDLTVPGGMGGIDTLSELKKMDPAVMAIVSSGYSTDPVMSDAQRFGFRGIVSKPYRIEELTRVLKTVLPPG